MNGVNKSDGWNADILSAVPTQAGSRNFRGTAADDVSTLEDLSVLEKLRAGEE